MSTFLMKLILEYIGYAKLVLDVIFEKFVKSAILIPCELGFFLKSSSSSMFTYNIQISLQ